MFFLEKELFTKKTDIKISRISHSVNYILIQIMSSSYCGHYTHIKNYQIDQLMRLSGRVCCDLKIVYLSLNYFLEMCPVHI